MDIIIGIVMKIIIEIAMKIIIEITKKLSCQLDPCNLAPHLLGTFGVFGDQLRHTGINMRR